MATITGTATKDAMDEPLSYLQAIVATPPLQRAVGAGALVGLTCACLSPFVVLRRMAFVGDGMAHAAFGGLGLGLFLISGSRSDDVAVQAITIGFCLLLALSVGLVSRRGGHHRISEDSAIGIAFSVAMALGALLITLRQRQEAQYAPNWEGYLFGSLITIGGGQVWLTLGLAAAVLAILAALHKELMYYTYDENLAEVSGLPVSFLHYLFLLLLVLTVVVSARLVGIVLVSASLVLPGLIALALCSSLGMAVAAAGLVGVLSYEAGLYASYVWNVPPGSMVILVQFALFLAATGVARVRQT
ncbi:MAG: metal ABC transporter permease [Planctomycetota bacterium]|nr:metal ABC transporter permease [Planctomycetota bacterium]